MTVETSTIVLLEVSSGRAVEAELRDAIEEKQLVDWQTEWQPALIGVLRQFAQRRVPFADWPQSWHWNWPKKMAQVQGLLAFQGFSVVCANMTQGLMRVDLTKFARVPAQEGKPLVYVDYLEVAPWNRPELGHTPRFRGVGTALVASAVALSEEEGFKGRIGLHSLPQADAFYRDKCGMTDLGPDPSCQNLRYFEMTPEQAGKSLEEEGGS